MAGRLALGAAVILGVASLLFVLQVLLVTGDFASVYRLSADEATIAALREHLGLSDPVGVRYGRWLLQVVQFDFGASFSGIDIGQALAVGWPYSMIVLVTATLIAYTVGISVGSRIGAASGNAAAAASALSAAVASVFPAALAFLLLYWFRRTVGIETFADVRRLDPSEGDPLSYAVRAGWGTLLWVVGVALVASSARFMLRRRQRHLGAAVLLIGGVATGFASRFAGLREVIDVGELLALPTLALALLLCADSVVLGIRRSRVEWHEPYVVTAHAKGLTIGMIRRKHVVPAVRPAMMARSVALLPVSLTGAVIVDAAFGQLGELSLSVPGLGGLIFGSLTVRDVPLALAGMLATGAVVVVLWVLLELAIWIADPRLRRS